MASAGYRLAGDTAGADSLIRKFSEFYANAEASQVVDAAELSGRLRDIISGRGVGSRVWNLLESLGVKHAADCGCLGTAERWNAWGVAGCRAARGEMVTHLRRNAKRFGFLAAVKAAVKALTTGAVFTWLNPLDPYGSIVDEAIRITEAENEPG